MVELDSVICGHNCDVLCGVDRESIDLVITSPPYGNLRMYGGFSDFDFYGVAWHLSRVLKPGGVIVWVVADQISKGTESGDSFRQALHFQELGLSLHDTMIWHKPNGAPGDGKVRYHRSFEYCFVISKGVPKSINLLRDVDAANPGHVKVKSFDRRKHDSISSFPKKSPWIQPEKAFRQNVWSISKPNFGDDGVVAHSASFPEKLVVDHMLSWSNDGDLVLDPFCGSGTVARVAKDNGRRFIAIDINPEYCQSTRERLRQGVLFGAT